MHKWSTKSNAATCRVAVIWIDWYPYHVARMRGLCSAPTLTGRVAGIELVGGVGVHAGLKFREDLPPDLAIRTLLPASDWIGASKWKLAKLLWHELTTLSPEAVLVPGYYTLPAVGAALWARLHGRTSILMSESAAYDHARHGWRELGKQSLLRVLFHQAVVGGRDHRAYLGQLGFPDDRIASFYDVVDNEFFDTGVEALLKSSSATEQRLPDSYFLYVGRLAAEKNVRGLVSAWLQYREHGGSWKLVLAGDGPERVALWDQVSGTTYSDDLVITGLCSAKQLLPLYAFASAFVLASTREPWGLVVNEAMAAGLPIIVSDRCGCANDLVVDSGCGYVVAAGDEQVLADALQAMANEPQASRAAMGMAARQRIREYNPHRFGLEVAGVLDRVNAHAQRGTQEIAV